LIPGLSEQRAIAAVLGALDDKIASNDSLSDSVDEYLAARFEESTRSSVKSIELSDVADVNRTTLRPRSDRMLRYIDIAAVGVGRLDFPERTHWSDAPGRARRGMERGDTIWSTVRPNRRSHALNLSSDPELVASTGLAVLSPRSVGFAYLYEATRRPEFVAYLENVAEGSAYPAVRAERFLHAPVPALDPEGVSKFEQLAAPLREASFAASEQNRTLAATRDALLPQLMSGKLRVRDAEKLASGAGA
jgi:type I restriction enzyme S subunit